jgi:hypothetical protein
MALKAMDPIDSVFCHLVKTKLYILVVALQIVVSAWLGRYIARRIVTPPSLDEETTEKQGL